MPDAFNPETLLAWFQALPEGLLYAVLALSAFVENVFPPVPGDTVTAMGAFLAGTERLSFPLVYAATTAGSLGGFMALFGIGRILGRRFFIKKDYPMLRAQKIRRAEAWFRRYGYLLVVLNRFIPGARSAISLAGGFTRLQTGLVALFALLSASVWNLAWMAAGYSLGTNWEKVESDLNTMMSRYTTSVIVLLGVFACAALAVRLIRLKRQRSGSTRGQEQPGPYASRPAPAETDSGSPCPSGSPSPSNPGEHAAKRSGAFQPPRSPQD